MRSAGGQVHGDAPERELTAAVTQGGADPLFRLLDRRVGKSDDVEDRQAGGDIHFNLDYEPIESKDRTGLNVPDTTASENYLLVSHRMVWS